MAEDDLDAKSDDGEEAPRGPMMIMGQSLPVFLLIVLNVICVSGGLGYIYYMKKVYKSPIVKERQELEKIRAAARKEREALLAVDGQVRILRLPEMNVNLRTQVGGKNHYANFAVALACNNQVCMDELKVFRAKIEDEIQTLVGTRSFNELSMGESIYRLKHSITKKVNSVIREGTVTDTFFYSYLVQ